MASKEIAKLIADLEQQVSQKSTTQEITCSLSSEDVIRLEAMADVFEMDAKELVASLLHTVLLEAEASMPYRPGTKVIRVEDGDPIYEDVGPTPRYLAAKRKLEMSGAA